MKSKRQKQIEARNRRIWNLFHIQHNSGNYLHLSLCLESVTERKYQTCLNDIKRLNRKLDLYENHLSPTDLNLKAIQNGMPLAWFN